MINGSKLAPDTSTSRMIALAQKICRETQKLEAYMKENGLPLPTLEVDTPADFPKLPEDLAQSRRAIIHATRELGMLAHGPRESLRWGVWEVRTTSRVHM